MRSPLPLTPGSGSPKETPKIPNTLPPISPRETPPPPNRSFSHAPATPPPNPSHKRTRAPALGRNFRALMTTPPKRGRELSESGFPSSRPSGTTIPSHPERNRPPKELDRKDRKRNLRQRPPFPRPTARQCEDSTQAQSVGSTTHRANRSACRSA